MTVVVAVALGATTAGATELTLPHARLMSPAAAAFDRAAHGAVAVVGTRRAPVLPR